MKKKLALLLALALTLASLPINVFGYSVDGVRLITPVYRYKANVGFSDTATVEVGLNYLFNNTKDAGFFITVTGDVTEESLSLEIQNVFGYDSTTYAAIAITTTPTDFGIYGPNIAGIQVSAPSDAGFKEAATQHGAYLRFFVTYTVPDGKNKDVEITVEPYVIGTDKYDLNPAKTMPVARKFDDTMYGVSYGKKVSFTQTGVLDTLTLDEVSVGAIPTNEFLVLKLVIQNPYISWTKNTASAAENAKNFPMSGLIVSSAIGPDSDLSAFYRIYDVGNKIAHSSRSCGWR